MSSPNVLQPINCNIRNSDGSPLSKRSKLDCEYDTKCEVVPKWSFSTSRNQMEMLAEMGLGMLDSDDVSEERNENDICNPSSSNLNHEHNDTNPDHIIPGDWSKSKPMDGNYDKFNDSTKKSTLNADLENSKTWENFCIYRRSSMINQDEKDWFTTLSDEIILLIFRWLPKTCLSRCALVCKRWCRLSGDETLWTRLDCSMKYLTEGCLGYILSRQVIILKLTGSEIVDPPILPDIKAYNSDFSSKLMYLDLSLATISTNSLAILFSKCRRLRKLSLEFCKVNDNVCMHLSQNEQLEVLNLSMAKGLAAMGLEYILKNCQQLKELNVAWTDLSEATLNTFCSLLPIKLNRLNVSGCRKTLHNKHIKEIVKNCPHLRELDISDGINLTNEAIKYIISLKELNFLAMSRCYAINHHILKKLNLIPSLQYLDIHGGHIDDTELENLNSALGNKVQLNKFMFSSIARPTVGLKRSSIWGLRVRD